jgi:hypothetical protein
MAKKPSEMNVVDRIFHDIALHGIDSVIKNQYFYKNYKPIELSQHDVIKSVCDDCTAYPFDERGKTPLCKTCKDNPSQTVL